MTSFSNFKFDRHSPNLTRCAFARTVMLSSICIHSQKRDVRSRSSTLLVVARACVRRVRGREAWQEIDSRRLQDEIHSKFLLLAGASVGMEYLGSTLIRCGAKSHRTRYEFWVFERKTGYCSRAFSIDEIFLDLIRFLLLRSYMGNT